MRRILVLALLVVAAGLSWPGPASACSVTEVPTEAEYVAMADVVFEGTAIGRHDANAGGAVISTGDPIVWTFSVDRPIKGAVALQQAVESARSGVSCGFTFTLGTRYRVYATYQGAVLRTGFPSGTREAPLAAVTTTSVPRAVPVPSPPRRIALTG